MQFLVFEPCEIRMGFSIPSFYSEKKALYFSLRVSGTPKNYLSKLMALEPQLSMLGDKCYGSE